MICDTAKPITTLQPSVKSHIAYNAICVVHGHDAAKLCYQIAVSKIRVLDLQIPDRAVVRGHKTPKLPLTATWGIIRIKTADAVAAAVKDAAKGDHGRPDLLTRTVEEVVVRVQQRFVQRNIRAQQGVRVCVRRGVCKRAVYKRRKPAQLQRVA